MGTPPKRCTEGTSGGMRWSGTRVPTSTTMERKHERRHRWGRTTRRYVVRTNSKGESKIFFLCPGSDDITNRPASDSSHGLPVPALTMSSTPMPMRMKGRICESDVKGTPTRGGVSQRFVGRPGGRTDGSTRKAKRQRETQGRVGGRAGAKVSQTQSTRNVRSYIRGKKGGEPDARVQSTTRTKSR